MPPSTPCLTSATTPPPSDSGRRTTSSTARTSHRGREGLFNLIRSLPPTLKYEHSLILADGDFVIVHGRYSGHGPPANWIVADIVLVQDGLLAEHWDVIQDEATREQSKSRLPMFGDSFPEYP